MSRGDIGQIALAIAKIQENLDDDEGRAIIADLQDKMQQLINIQSNKISAEIELGKAEYERSVKADEMYAKEVEERLEAAVKKVQKTCDCAEKPGVDGPCGDC